jgi:YHS domain-containing protein
VNYAFCSPHCRKKFSDEPERYTSEVAAKLPKDDS